MAMGETISLLRRASVLLGFAAVVFMLVGSSSALAIEERCSAGELVCKSVTFADADADGIIELGEEVVFTFTFTVHNPSAVTWTNVTVKDNFAGDLEVHSTTPSQ
jgi:uncharacterized repeat protein (TIGR01451 family)